MTPMGSACTAFWITGEATRTPDLRIMRPPLQNRKDIQSNDLRQHTPELTAHGQRATSNDPGLAAVVGAWPKLPEAIKAGILAMVGAAKAEAGK